MKNLNGFVVGSDFQVQYPVGGDRNILAGRENGRILNVGTNKQGNPFVFIKYVAPANRRNSGGHRIATLSIAKMVNPVVFS